MSEKLEPCPFCGGEARLHNYKRHGDHWSVRCAGDDCKVYPGIYGFPTMDEAAAAWNRRAAYEDSGLTPDELPRAAELYRAEKEGRLAELPCKINDIAWELYRRIGGEDSIRPIQFWWSDIPRLGKTVFLTYTEAEAVLGGGGDG